MRRFALVLVALIAPPPSPAAAAESWTRPVQGEVTRAFAMRGSPYAAGRHRGADFAAPPGSPVGAPCSGRVAVAARIGTSGGVVTVACGPWRVSVLPLLRIAAHRGARVRAGDLVGTAAAGSLHAGLHLGVRRAGRRFGYVDPLRFLGHGHPPPPAPLAPRGRVRPPAPLATPAPAQPVAAGDTRRPGVLPWPAWAGAALLLAAASGGLVRRRAGRAARARTRASPARGG